MTDDDAYFRIDLPDGPPIPPPGPDDTVTIAYGTCPACVLGRHHWTVTESETFTASDRFGSEHTLDRYRCECDFWLDRCECDATQTMLSTTRTQSTQDTADPATGTRRPWALCRRTSWPIPEPQPGLSLSALLLQLRLRPANPNSAEEDLDAVPQPRRFDWLRTDHRHRTSA